jgi:hypothetical protein
LVRQPAGLAQARRPGSEWSSPRVGRLAPKWCLRPPVKVWRSHPEGLGLDGWAQVPLSPLGDDGRDDRDLDHDPSCTITARPSLSRGRGCGGGAAATEHLIRRSGQVHRLCPCTSAPSVTQARPFILGRWHRGCVAVTAAVKTSALSGEHGRRPDGSFHAGQRPAWSTVVSWSPAWSSSSLTSTALPRPRGCLTITLVVDLLSVDPGKASTGVRSRPPLSGLILVGPGWHGLAGLRCCHGCCQTRRCRVREGAGVDVTASV